MFGTYRKIIYQLGRESPLPSKAFPSEPLAMVEQAVQDALASVAAAEDVPLDDLTCVRDYSAACPTGVIL